MEISIAQFNNQFSFDRTAYYLPYSAGLLKAYARERYTGPEELIFRPLLYRRQDITGTLERIAGSTIAAFSTYTWNWFFSLEVARRAKTEDPNLFIILGGPQVPFNSEDFLRENPYIDLCIHNEGERPFTQVLEQFRDRDFAKIPGVSYIIPENGGYVFVPPGKRIADLEEVPSPFLAGAFDDIMAEADDVDWLTIWETNRGCPFSCTFCDWGSAVASKVTRFGLDRLYAEIDWFIEKRISYLFCADANFGILPRDLEIANYVADRKRNTGYPQTLFIQGTKNQSTRAYEVQKVLYDAQLSKGVTLSMQSTDIETLSAIKRSNISLDSYSELQIRFANDRVLTYTDLILGLPGETYKSFTGGICQLIDKGQHNRIFVNNCAILPNAEMNDPVYRRTHGIQAIESDVVYLHGASVDYSNDVSERVELIVGTKSMPNPDWKRARKFAWTVSLFYFNKLLHVPLNILNHMFELEWVDLFEEIIALGQENPVLKPVFKEMDDFIERMIAGEPELRFAPNALQINWYLDEFLFIEICQEDKIDSYYEAMRNVLHKICVDHGISDFELALNDAIALNQWLLRLPGGMTQVEHTTATNVFEIYRELQIGQTVPFVQVAQHLTADPAEVNWSTFDDWCRFVVWRGSQRGLYLYDNITTSSVMPMNAAVHSQIPGVQEKQSL